MNSVKLNYYILLAIIVAPVFLFVFGQQSELLYGFASFLVFVAFLFVSYRIQLMLNKECDQLDSTHLRRQTDVILTFIVSGILAAIYSIIRYHMDSELWATNFRLLAWLVYIWGVISLGIGFKQSVRPSDTPS